MSRFGLGGYPPSRAISSRPQPVEFTNNGRIRDVWEVFPQLPHMRMQAHT